MGGLYKSEEWKLLDKIGRAQLLLVIEGLKRGTSYAFGDQKSLMEILERTGLGHALSTRDAQSLDPMMLIARPDDLQERARRQLALPENADIADFSRVDGWVLGYPGCCVEDYVRKRTPEEVKAFRSGKRHLIYNFNRGLEALIKSQGGYSDIFDFRPPHFTPCAIDCPDATKSLTSWKDAIESLDPEAGRELVYANRSFPPSCLAHGDYLQVEGAKRSLEYRTEFIRRSIQ